MIAAPSTATSPGRSVFGRKKEKEAGKLPKEFLPGFWDSLGNEGGDAVWRTCEFRVEADGNARMRRQADICAS